MTEPLTLAQIRAKAAAALMPAPGVETVHPTTASKRSGKANGTRLKALMWAPGMANRAKAEAKRPPKEQLAAMLRQHGVKETCKLVGVSDDTILRWRREDGIVGRMGTTPYPGHAVVRQAYRELGRTALVCERLGIKRSLCHDWAKRAGITFSGCSYRPTCIVPEGDE